ncbi:hypothetical protein B0T11DRAFT_326540 [Plectosphaerella cucumerina]|uniref:Uncharacterized protein n=1 Tax=Plectosphaerella cucumerina TaxID=40658 RepID=A0A8K0TNB8_9PEZI|nr:hypothetical protein B0T11DRAFT_326540 [Plectosphaerella cucumerina]
MAPPNPGWRPVYSQEIEKRRSAMAIIADRLVKFYVAGTDLERKMLRDLAFNSLVLNVNKTAYNRTIFHENTGPLSKVLQGTKFTIEAAIAFAILQSPARARSLAPGNALMAAIADRVSRLIGEDGRDCFIPEGFEKEEEEAHTVITKAMALDAHFRYYGRQFVTRVEAAARFPAPDATGFIPVTSEMRYNMPILCPGQVKAEVDLLMLFESDWKESDNGERELADILDAAKKLAGESRAVADAYRLMNHGESKEHRENAFALLTIVFAYAEIKILENHQGLYQAIHTRVFNARLQAHIAQLKQSTRPIVFGQQNVDTQNPATFRHHAWREPSTPGTAWEQSPGQLPYAPAPAVDDGGRVIDIVDPAEHWKRVRFADNRTKNRTRERDIIGFQPNDIDAEPLVTSEAIANELEAQQPNISLRRWGIDESRDVEFRFQYDHGFTDDKKLVYNNTALPANRNEGMDEIDASITLIFEAQGNKPIVVGSKKGKSVAAANAGDESQASTPGPGPVSADTSTAENENETSNTETASKAAPGIGIQLPPSKPEPKKRKAAADTGSGVSAPTAAKRKAIDAEIQEKNAALAHHAEKIMKLDKRIEELETQAEAQKLVIKERDTQITDLTATVDAKEREVLSVQSELGSSHLANQLLQTKAKNLEREMEKLKSENQKLETANAQLRALDKLRIMQDQQAQQSKTTTLEIQKLRERIFGG